MSIEELISGLEGPDPRAKKKACKALGELGDQQAVPKIIRLLEDSELEDDWWRAGTFALGKIGGDVATNYLLSSLKKAEQEIGDDDDHERRTGYIEGYVHALSRIRTRPAIDGLFELLVSEDEHLRNGAQAALYGSIKVGSTDFDRLSKIHQDDKLSSPESQRLYHMVRMKAGIHPDGSVNFSAKKPDFPKITKEVFFDPKEQMYWFEDEHGNIVECDNAGNEINVVDGPSSYLVYWKIENVRLAESTPNWCHACWGSDRRNFESWFEKGDIVYFVTTDEDGYHSLFSKITLDSFIGSKADAEDVVPFSLTSVDFETYWLAKKPWSQLFDVPFGEIALELNFESGNKLPPDFTGQNLQTPRKLIISDVGLLDDLISVYTE